MTCFIICAIYIIFFALPIFIYFLMLLEWGLGMIMLFTNKFPLLTSEHPGHPGKIIYETESDGLSSDQVTKVTLVNVVIRRRRVVHLCLLSMCGLRALMLLSRWTHTSPPTWAAAARLLRRIWAEKRKKRTVTGSGGRISLLLSWALSGVITNT